MRAVVAFVLVVPAVAAADLRTFAQTDEYSTQPEDSTSIQLSHTLLQSTWDRETPSYFQRFDYAITVQHGIAERFDASLTTTFTQVDEGALRFDRLELAANYRFVDRADLPVDVMLGALVAKQFAESIYPIGARIVLARDFDDLLVAGNAGISMQLGDDIDDRDVSFVWAGGASYQLHTAVRLGAEAWGRTGDLSRALAGPVLQLVPSTRLWLVVGAGFGFTDASEAFEGRAVLGIEL